jgi:hypothetical protein
MTIRHTNDLMFEGLKALYPEMVNPTLGDLMSAWRDDIGQENRGSLQYAWYAERTPIDGRDTLGDAANRFWGDPDFSVFNLELEDGTDLLLEDDGFVLLESGS